MIKGENTTYRDVDESPSRDRGSVRNVVGVPYLNRLGKFQGGNPRNGGKGKLTVPQKHYCIVCTTSSTYENTKTQRQSVHTKTPDSFRRTYSSERPDRWCMPYRDWMWAEFRESVNSPHSDSRLWVVAHLYVTVLHSHMRSEVFVRGGS